MKIKVEAPCKINLSLDIITKRLDSYHEMDMIMQTVSLSDTLILERVFKKNANIIEDNIIDNIILECSDKKLPCDKTNIIYRCAKGFFDKTKLYNNNETLLINLKKQIPMMAGLGGGSADGAATLIALNKLFNAQLSLDELCKIGVEFGADIPFCIKGGTARVRGIGEIITPLPKMPECFIVIVKPEFSVSTKAAFAAWDAKKQPHHADIISMTKAIGDGNLKNIAEAMCNVFESLCDKNSADEIIRLINLMLKHGALGARMTGSGSAVFGIFEGEKEANKCHDFLLKNSDVQNVFICTPVPA